MKSRVELHGTTQGRVVVDVAHVSLAADDTIVDLGRRVAGVKPQAFEHGEITARGVVAETVRPDGSDIADEIGHYHVVCHSCHYEKLVATETSAQQARDSHAGSEPEHDVEYAELGGQPASNTHSTERSPMGERTAPHREDVQ